MAQPARPSQGEARQIPQSRGNLLPRVRALVLDDEQLRATRPRGAEDRREIELARAHDDVRVIGRAAAPTGKAQATPHVLDVQQRDAARERCDDLRRICAPGVRPEHIDLERHERRVGVLGNRVEERSLVRRDELVAVAVIPEAEPPAPRVATHGIEDRARAKRQLARQTSRLVVGNPRADDMAGAELLRLAEHGGRVAREALVVDVNPAAHQIGLVERVAKRARRQPHQPRRLDLSNPERAQTSQRSGDVAPFEIAPQAPQLDADGAAERPPRFSSGAALRARGERQAAAAARSVPRNWRRDLTRPQSPVHTTAAARYGGVVRGACVFHASLALLACAWAGCRPGNPPATGATDAVVAHAAVRPGIARIAAIRLWVTDVEKSREFYATVLGLSASDQTTFPVDSGQRIELAAAPSTPPASLLAGVVFATDDVGGMRRYLVAHGVAAGPLATDAAGAQRFDLADPEGHALAFEQTAPDARAPFRAGPQQVGTRILHAGFVVNERATLDRFYRDLLGFRMYWHGAMTDTGADDWVEVQIPDGDDWLEYMLNVPADAGHDDRGVMNHFALGVPHMQPAFDRLRAHGYKTDDQPEIGRDGKWQFDIFDPDATRVEFMEFTPARAPCCHPYEAAHPRG